MLGYMKKALPYIGLILLLSLIIFSAYSSGDEEKNEQKERQNLPEMAHYVCQRCQVDGMKTRLAKNARQHQKLDVDMAVLLRKFNSTCVLSSNNKKSLDEGTRRGLTSTPRNDEISYVASHAEIKNKMEQLAGAYDDVAYEYISILKNLSQEPNFNPPTGLDENRKAAQQNALWLKTEVLCGCEDNHAAR